MCLYCLSIHSVSVNPNLQKSATRDDITIGIPRKKRRWKTLPSTEDESLNCTLQKKGNKSTTGVSTSTEEKTFYDEIKTIRGIR